MDIKNFIIAGLIFSGVMSLFLSIYALKHKHKPTSLPFSAATLIITFYSCGYAFELYSVTLDGIKLALRIEYIGISFIPAVWLILAIIYTGRQKILTWWVYVLLFFIPVTTLILHYTNDFHHLFYKNLDISPGPPFPLAVITKGIWYHVHILNSNLAALIGNSMYILWIIQNKGPYRRQGIAMLIASLAPWIGNAVYQAGLIPYGIDIIPFSMALSGPIFAIALFKYRMLDLSPIARDIIFETMRDPVIVMDESSRVVDYNRCAADLFNLSSEHHFIGKDMSLLFCEYPGLITQIREQPPGSIEIEMMAGPKARSFASVLTPITQNSRWIGTILTLSDITGHKEMLEKLNALATVDELTKINNRRQFFNLSIVELIKAQRNKRPVCAMVIDLDYFKTINDQYGHATGDRVLKAAASALSSGLRESDIIGRYGGEEFTVFLPETHPQSAMAVAQRLRQKLVDLDIFEGPNVINITASIGVSGINVLNGEDLDYLVKLADDALYLAKKKGRNRIEATFSS